MIEQIKSLPKARRKQIGDAISSTVEAWGNPHHHSGISIQRITKDIYESRVDRATRLAFMVQVVGHRLVFFFMGDHADIQNLIKSAR